ncbi:hypothetical protein J6590_097727 [Homalodisca vitripennis]|nr:hypothetical protein J6590_097727 [Homalodisca vitripennis]
MLSLAPVRSPLDGAPDETLIMTIDIGSRRCNKRGQQDRLRQGKFTHTSSVTKAGYELGPICLSILECAKSRIAIRDKHPPDVSRYAHPPRRRWDSHADMENCYSPIMMERFGRGVVNELAGEEHQN